jgi:flagellar basal-body rod protein FlgF
VGGIRLMEFPDEEMPQKFSEGLYISDKGTVSKNSLVQPGHIEESNVNAIGEMVKMIQGMRGYETAQKLIQTLDRMTETAIQDIGRVA